MGQITKAVGSVYKAGDVVTVTSPGSTYSTYLDMAIHLGLEAYRHGLSNLFLGEEVIVIGSAMHRMIGYGEVVGVRKANGDEVLIGAKGLSEPITRLNATGHVLDHHERAWLVDGNSALQEAAQNAPAWALYVGQDDCGIHYFDHHPYIYSETSLLKGLLPDTHRVQHNRAAESGPIRAMRIPKVQDTPTETIEGLKRELAEVKAKLWAAENKLGRIKEVVA